MFSILNMVYRLNKVLIVLRINDFTIHIARNFRELSKATGTFQVDIQ